MTMFNQMLRGKTPLVPNTSLPMVEVRDVAQLHVQAMTSPDVTGKRLVASTTSHQFCQGCTDFKRC